MTNITTPTLFQDDIYIQYVQSSTGGEIAVSVRRTYLTNKAGQPLPKPVVVELHPLDTLALLAESIKSITERLAEQPESGGGLVLAGGG